MKYMQQYLLQQCMLYSEIERKLRKREKKSMEDYKP